MADMFSKRLSVLLQQRNMSQKALAIKAGVTEAAISHYLKGDRTPRALALARISEALGTTTDYLMGGDEADSVGELNYAKRLIARNVHQMSQEEKLDLIKILMSED